LFNKNSNGPKVSINSNNIPLKDAEVAELFEQAQILWKDLQSGVAANMEEELHNLVKKAEDKDKRSMASVMQMMFGDTDQAELSVQVRPSVKIGGSVTKSRTKVEYNLKENGPNPNLQATDIQT